MKIDNIYLNKITPQHINYMHTETVRINIKQDSVSSDMQFSIMLSRFKNKQLETSFLITSTE